MQDNLLHIARSYGQLPATSSHLSPHPALLPEQFLEDIQAFHKALAIALNNIVERWWTDTEADFPSRMPLEPQVTDLLQVVNQSRQSSRDTYTD
jgi:hypothetical protein